MRLYHGTTKENALKLLKEGWRPNQVSSGANGGQSRYLYLTTVEDNALWFAEQKGDDVVLVVEDINEEMLMVDPEDGIGDTVEEEIEFSQKKGFPANFALKTPVGPERFKLVRGKV